MPFGGMLTVALIGAGSNIAAGAMNKGKGGGGGGGGGGTAVRPTQGADVPTGEPPTFGSQDKARNIAAKDTWNGGGWPDA